MRLLLASKSPARRQTLINAGITPLIVVSKVDEDAVLANLPGGRAFSGGTTPADEVLALATAKCRAVAEDLLTTGGVDQSTGDPLPATEDLVLIGCDSMLELDGRMLGKPHTPEVAVERIKEMRERDAVLWTGHYAMRLTPTQGPEDAVRTIQGEAGASASTLVHFGTMSDEEIDAYVASGEPLKVAGSFTIDSLGGPFISGVTGDHHSVVGISLPLTRSLFAELGVFWPDLWDHRR
ncbi:nucleoside triphosphate pyrophosphatase [Schaalia sp. Marseille-Q2122]|uniref:Maf family protein n=1 Tax=Schaalia sp. Marseille-Q2122 TaxID=2736604 RepID=UPI00158C0C55|nr:Maf family protein [Schaalia sp. Marseille-Q2122]